MGLLDFFVGVEFDFVVGVGVEVGLGVVWDVSQPANSGFYFSSGDAAGLNVGVGLGGGGAARDVEGHGTGVDANLGKVSVAVSADDEGINQLGVSGGPGIGASLSGQDTTTTTFKQIGEWIKEKLFGKGIGPRPLPKQNDDKK